MSAFTEGQTVTVTGDTQNYRHGFRAGTTATVVNVDGSSSTYVEAGGREVWVANLDLEAPTTEPAPLDHSAVKPGDTVTLTRGKAKVEDTVYAITKHGDIETDNFDDPFDMEDWTLTAHQPAPEPVPEWKGGTVGTATLNNLLNGATRPGVRVMRFETQSGRLGFVSEHGDLVSDDSLDVSVSDFVPDALSDPTTARKAVVDALATVLAVAVDYEQLNAATDAVVAALGIEAAS